MSNAPGKLSKSRILKQEEKTKLFLAATNGDLRQIRQYFKKYPNSKRAVDSHNNSLLHLAAKSGQTELIKLLLNSDISPNGGGNRNGSC